MDKLNKKQNRRLSVSAITSIVVLFTLMYVETQVTPILDNPFIAIIYLLVLCVGFFSLFALVINFPNTY